MHKGRREVLADIDRLSVLRVEQIKKLLEQRAALIEEISKLKPNDPASLPAVKARENKLRDVDEALAILRFGV